MGTLTSSPRAVETGSWVSGCARTVATSGTLRVYVDPQDPHDCRDPVPLETGSRRVRTFPPRHLWTLGLSAHHEPKTKCLSTPSHSPGVLRSLMGVR